MQKDFIKNFKIIPLNLNDNSHKLILKNMYDLNFRFIRDDAINDFDSLCKAISYYLNNGDDGFLVFVNNEPYGALYVSYDGYNNATIHALTYDKFDNFHFYTTQRFLKSFISYLFNKKHVNKIICEIPAYHKKAEASIRYAGFRKEGYLLGSMRINKKPIHTLLFGITKEQYFEGAKDIKAIKETIKKIDPERKRRNGKKEISTRIPTNSSSTNI